MKIALITGANKGIGYETAKQLAKQDCFVYIGSRDKKNGEEAVSTLRALGIKNVEAIHIDVTDTASILAASSLLQQMIGKLDLLINNAGISGNSPYEVLNASDEQFQEVYDVNVFGVVKVCKAFIDLIKKSDAGRIVNVSTSVGSLTLQNDPTWPAYHYAKYAVYASSKAALNMITVQLAYELKDTNIKVNAVCPGYTKTDFTGHLGGEVSQAAKRILKYALLDREGPTGKFFSEETNPETKEIPW